MLPSSSSKTYLLLTLAVFGQCALPNVTVRKCCGLDEFMTNFSNSSYGCLNATTKPDDYLKIYYGKKGGLTNKIPSNWNIIKSMPNCEDPVRSLHTPVVLFANGSLFAPNGGLVHPDNYCYDSKLTFICTNEPRKTIVRKCCGGGALYSETKRSCLNVNVKDYKIEIGDSFKLDSGFPSCDGDLSIVGVFDGANLHENGSLARHDADEPLREQSFCIEHVLEKAGAQPSIFTCHDNSTNPLKTTTITGHAGANSDLRFILYPIGLAISVIFLTATLAASYLLPASHHVLHWKCQRNHILCLLIGDIVLCFMQLKGEMGKSYCILVAVSMHFLFLSAFFWLNTMCFNIWWTFRDFRPQNLEKSQERFRLRLYEIYAWGVPLLIAGVAALLDLTATEAHNSTLLRPKFATNSCWFHGDMAIFAYFFGPIGILLCVNVILFAATARELTCGLWKRELVKSTTERAALGRVCIKLVVVMGVTWIADIVSWVVGGPSEVWYFTDLINCLQGVFIFIVVGCQPQVLCAVKRLWCFNKNRRVETAGTTNHHSSSSHGLPSLGDSTLNHTTVTTNSKAIPLEPTNC